MAIQHELPVSPLLMQCQICGEKFDQVPDMPVSHVCRPTEPAKQRINHSPVFPGLTLRDILVKGSPRGIGVYQSTGPKSTESIIIPLPSPLPPIRPYFEVQAPPAVIAAQAALNEAMAAFTQHNNDLLFSSLTRVMTHLDDACDPKTISHVPAVTITPELAGLILRHNLNNRNIHKNNVRKLVGAMERGEWRVNGEPLIFNKDNRLMDGQNRLLAVLQSGVTIQIDIRFDIANIAETAMGMGGERKLHHILYMKKYKMPTILAAALPYIERWEAGHLGGTNAGVITPTQWLNTLNRHPGLLDAVSKSTRTRPLLAPTLSAVTRYLFSLSDAESTDLFFKQLSTGQGLQPDSPLAVMRTKLIANCAKRADETRIQPRMMFALLIKTWNATVCGKLIRSIIWKPAKEAFPAIAGLPAPETFNPPES